MVKLSIIIPVFNEKNSLHKIIQLIEDVSLPNVEKELIIVDDGSTDGTAEIVKELAGKHQVVLFEKNQGKGAAITAGFKKATGDICLIQDADLEYDPKDYQELIQPIIENRADVVYGSRFVGSKPHRVLYAYHYFGNRLITHFSNLLTNLSLTDIETCYKAFSRQAIQQIIPKLTAKRFGIEVELTALIAKLKLRVYEIGVAYYGRTYQEGKKIYWTDGIKALYYVVKYNLLK